MNKNNAVLYTGVTARLKSRVYDHKTKRNPKCFTARYNVDKLVYYECFNRIENAIFREKQLKGGSRKKKLELIQQSNSEYRDLFEGAPE